MSHMTIGRRVGLGFVACLTGLIVTALIGTWALGSVASSKDEVLERRVPLVSGAHELEAIFATKSATGRGYLISGDAHLLTVRDHGEGIATQHLPRLTERFYRVDAARSRDAGGTGLGLAIVKHIAERHRGTLDFQSTTGAGTLVTVSLPLADAVTKL